MSRILPDDHAKQIKDALIQLIEHIWPEVDHLTAMDQHEEAREASGLI